MADLQPLPETHLERPATAQTALPDGTSSFVLGPKHKSYKNQFANIYYIRLHHLRKVVEDRAEERWREVAGSPELVPRVLDVVKSTLCYVIGTVYMEMPLKPNVLEDVGRDRSIPAPPPREKFHSPDDIMMLEDESGRLQLVGERVSKLVLVTGVIMAALGRETAQGEFEVFDVCFAGLPPPVKSIKDEKMDVDDQDSWVAIVSGLEVGPPSSMDIRLQMLVEYLTSESGGEEEQASSSKVSRLIIAGNTFALPSEAKAAPTDASTEKKSKKYGHDSSIFNPHPTNTINAHLLDIATCLPIHLLAGASDPSGILLPQQPLPRAMFGSVRSFPSFSTETNPVWLGLGSRTLFVSSGQPLDDMFKYVPTPPVTRLQLAAESLRWRHVAPTAPDTLWCYPYLQEDPFLMNALPDVYVVGNQPEFATKLVVGDGGETCRVVLVPRFVETGTLVMVNLATSAVKTIQFDVAGFNT